MEDKSCHSTSHADIIDHANGIVRPVTRDLPPAHYTFQIKNFSVVKTIIDKCESAQFEVGGYQWKLVLHPNQNKNGKENGHISLYLAIEDTDKLSHGWEVNTYIRFLVFDQIRDKFLCIQDEQGSVRRFHKLKTKWGFEHLISHDTLNDPSSGYVVDDTCVFGVEVFVIKGTFKGECFSMINEPQSTYFTWTISRFSALKYQELNYSKRFVVGGHEWKLVLVKGTDLEDELSSIASLSLFLNLISGSDTELFSNGGGVYVKFKLRIRDQQEKGNHCERTCGCWFSHRSTSNGFPNFLRLGLSHYGLTKYYLMGDCLVVQCKIDAISATKGFDPLVR